MNMKLCRKTCRDGNLYPVVVNYLKDLPLQVLYHKDHKMHHPYSIYRRSLEKILKAFDAVLNELDKVYKAPLDVNHQLADEFESLSELQEKLLGLLLPHIDDCYNILKTIHPPLEINNPSDFADKWLKQAKHSTVNDFSKNINDYRKSFASIANRIKHQGGKLCCIVIYPIKQGIVAYYSTTGLYWNTIHDRIAGYYLEGVQDDGCIGLDPIVHPDNTAISFNRDLKYHFANIYIVGLHLKNAIVNSIRRLHNIDLTKPRNVDLSSDEIDIETIASRISKLPSLFFENEFNQLTPDIIYQSNNQDANVIIEFPSPYKIFWIGDHIMSCHGRIDFINTEYRPPYAQKYFADFLKQQGT